ncbi:MAG TPA: hypothetical protein VNO32_12935, partial [Candidatus Acidoferrum sp.]|nr:hypothetical protein [Candidatus Acidoferrum sp.]
TMDEGQHWTNVSPKMPEWSTVDLIEPSPHDANTAYVAIDRHKLDDVKPYIFKTTDAGKTWSAITTGIPEGAIVHAVREDPKRRGLLYAGTELGMFVSFDDGAHWQPLQLNLPVSPIHDLVVKDDDLVVATHGRSFWILDDITPLRQALDAEKDNAFWLYHPAPAYRIDNDSFQGTPLPPEEPTAENPPAGAILDYFLKSSASTVSLEIFDAQQNLVHKFSSEDKHPEKRPPLPIAERWFPKPEVLGTNPGLQRFVWDLSWSSSGGQSVDEESEFRNPRGPKVVPGIYTVRLTVDGKAQTQPLEVVMDPRSAATPEILHQQLQLGRQIFAETMEARRALAEIASLRKQLADLQQKVGKKDSAIEPALADAQTEISKIETRPGAVGESSGLQDAFADMAAALRVVESGDRAVPSQAVAVYKESSQRVKAAIAEWNEFKTTKLQRLNQKLSEAGDAPIAISEIEQEVQFLMSR